MNPLVYLSEGFRAALTPVPHMSLAAVYPVVILFNWLVASSLRTEQLWLRSLWLPLVLAPALTYLLLPGLSRLFRWWLRR